MSATTARDWLERIRALPLPQRVRIMNVCGGHERAIAAAGLRLALPEQIELIAGPGCPVCICPEEDVYEAMQLALHGHVVLAFGDMLRVPVNVPKSEPRSLEQAKAAGADIRPIASPLEAVRIAAAEPARTFVLFAAGFETTTAPVAAMLAAGVLKGLAGARIGVIVFSGLALGGLVLLMGMGEIPELPVQVPYTRAFLAVCAVLPALGIWCVTRADVKRWFRMKV